MTEKPDVSKKHQTESQVLSKASSPQENQLGITSVSIERGRGYKHESEAVHRLVAVKDSSSPKTPDPDDFGDDPPEFNKKPLREEVKELGESNSGGGFRKVSRDGKRRFSPSTSPLPSTHLENVKGEQNTGKKFVAIDVLGLKLSKPNQSFTSSVIAQEPSPALSHPSSFSPSTLPPFHTQHSSDPNGFAQLYDSLNKLPTPKASNPFEYRNEFLTLDTKKTSDFEEIDRPNSAKKEITEDTVDGSVTRMAPRYTPTYAESRMGKNFHGFHVLFRPAVNKHADDVPFIPFIPDEMYSGMYSYKLLLKCPSTLADISKIRPRLMSADPDISRDSTLYLYNQNWKEVGLPKSGISKFEMISTSTGDDNQKEVQFMFRFGVNSHSFGRCPFIFELLNGDSLIYQSRPFHLYARRNHPNCCFWQRNFGKNWLKKRKRTSSSYDSNSKNQKTVSLQVPNFFPSSLPSPTSSLPIFLNPSSPLSSGIDPLSGAEVSKWTKNRPN